MNKSIAGAIAGVATIATAALGVATPAAAETSQRGQAIQGAQSSQVSVVHGIPGQPVDVYVNGEQALSGFQPATVAGPLELPAGSYDIAITAPGEPISNALLQVDNAEVPADQNLSLVAHLSAEGEPTLTPFANDASAVEAGQARVIVRHTAAAPAVDVRVGGQPVFQNLTNPNEAKADVDAGTISADVVLAGTDNVVLGPADLDLTAGAATIVYAIGSAQDDTLELVTQEITGLGGAPEGVPAGTGGLAGGGLAGWWYAMAGAGLMLLLGGIAAATRRVRHPHTRP